MGSSPTSIAEAVEWFRKRFQPGAAEGISVRYQMELSGSAGGVLSAIVSEGRLEAAAEAVPQPDVVYRLSADDFFGILGGSQNPDLLFMEDRIRIDGDLSLALKLRTLFSNAG